MSHPALLRLLQHRIGLDAASLGERVISDALAEARIAQGVADDEALYGRVLASPDAWSDLVERFVVAESWFFRSADQLADVVRYAREQPRRRPLRLLSLPCASGEEAWSAVIALLEAGVPAEGIDVLGIDVSRAAIARAQAGVFRTSALRGSPMPEAWVSARAGGFAMGDRIRRCVRFRHGNALDPALLSSSERFDVVFCRNLLIYLQTDARKRVLETLLGALEPGGMLCTGHAEALDMAEAGLRPFAGGCPSTYILGGAEPERPRSAPSPRARATGSRDAGVAVRTPAAPTATTQAAQSRAAALESPSPQALADAGRLDEARAACRDRLRLHPEDVACLFLLGVIESARADLAAAEAAFARVCYLDRNHLAAMDYRVALAERQGRDDLAADLRQRADRLRKRLGRTA